jgi:hypothetical protein
LSSDITLSSGNHVLVIENGLLDLNGHTLATASGAALTIVFTGTNSNCGSCSHYPTGAGTLNISAPTSGPWSGIVIAQDASLSSGLDISYSGNSPTWDMTGLIYVPNSNVLITGAVNKSGTASCFVLEDYTLTVKGTGDIFAGTSSCASAGLTNGAVGGELVF